MGEGKKEKKKKQQKPNGKTTTNVWQRNVTHKDTGPGISNVDAFLDSLDILLLFVF